MRTLATVMMLALGASAASAEVRTKVVEYTQGNTDARGLPGMGRRGQGPASRRPGGARVDRARASTSSRAPSSSPSSATSRSAPTSTARACGPTTPEEAGKTAGDLQERPRPDAGARERRPGAAAGEPARGPEAHRGDRLLLRRHGRPGARAQRGGHRRGRRVPRRPLDNPTPGRRQEHPAARCSALQGGDDPFVGSEGRERVREGDAGRPRGLAARAVRRRGARVHEPRCRERQRQGRRPTTRRRTAAPGRRCGTSSPRSSGSGKAPAGRANRTAGSAPTRRR